MRKMKWIAIVAAANMFALSCAGAAEAAKIQIIGTDESEVLTEAAPGDAAAGTGSATGEAGSSDSAAAIDPSFTTDPGGTADPAETKDPAAADSAATDLPSATAPGAGDPAAAQDASAVSAAGILNPAEEGITAEEAVSAARTLYSQMQHYADINDNSSFAALFEAGADVQTVQDQLQAVKSSLSETKELDMHADLCFFDPTQDKTRSPYYFAVALCDYGIDPSGAVSWYSTLIRLAKYEAGWKVSISPASDLLSSNYPDGFTQASEAGRNSVDLYPSLGMRFASGAVFEGALYALPNLLWQDEDGAVQCAVWVANGTATSKWCDTIDLVVKDSGIGDVMKVNVPVQTALEGGQSAMVTCSVPAEYVDSGSKEWTQISVSSNLRYQ